MTRGAPSASEVATWDYEDAQRLAREALVDELVGDIAGGIAVLNDKRGGVPGLGISDDLIRERAANIVTGLLGNYRIEAL